MVHGPWTSVPAAATVAEVRALVAGRGAEAAGAFAEGAFLALPIVVVAALLGRRRARRRLRAERGERTY